MNAFQGLLEPYARITCTCGSEGSGAQQCAPLTRLISPCLLNVALHGLEEAAGVRYRTGVHAGESEGRLSGAH